MSDLGNLSQCMVDNDPEVRARARRLRQKALVVSLCLEAVCLGGMLLWPLITPGVLPVGYLITPVPPYRGGGGGHVSHPNPTHRPEPHAIPRPTSAQIIFNPHHTSTTTQPLDTDVAIVGDVGHDGEGISAGPPGPGVPWAPDNSRGIVIPRPVEPVRPPRQRMTEGVMEGALIHRVEPVYPMIARTMHLSGIVRLRAIIATDGSVQNLEVLSGQPILARAAEQAVLQWRYRPTLLNGVPVEVETYITVTFVLGSQ